MGCKEKSYFFFFFAARLCLRAGVFVKTLFVAAPASVLEPQSHEKITGLISRLYSVSGSI